MQPNKDRDIGISHINPLVMQPNKDRDIPYKSLIMKPNKDRDIPYKSPCNAAE